MTPTSLLDSEVDTHMGLKTFNCQTVMHSIFVGSLTNSSGSTKIKGRMGGVWGWGVSFDLSVGSLCMIPCIPYA